MVLYTYLEWYFSNPDSNSLYLVHEFQQQFGLSSCYELCLIIPAVKPHVTIEELVEDIKDYDTPQKYFASESPKADSKKYEEKKSWYFDLPPLEENSTWSKSFPPWAIDSFKKGSFPPLSLLKAYKGEQNILFSVVETVKFESAWLISQEIRQHIYGLLDVPADSVVKEAM